MLEFSRVFSHHVGFQKLGELGRAKGGWLGVGERREKTSPPSLVLPLFSAWCPPDQSYFPLSPIFPCFLCFRNPRWRLSILSIPSGKKRLLYRPGRLRASLFQAFLRAGEGAGRLGIWGNTFSFLYSSLSCATIPSFLSGIIGKEAIHACRLLSFCTARDFHARSRVSLFCLETTACSLVCKIKGAFFSDYSGLGIVHRSCLIIWSAMSRGKRKNFLLLREPLARRWHHTHCYSNSSSHMAWNFGEF